MKTCWLHQQGRQDCLLFFAGWGMDPAPFYDIPAGTVDVLMVSDYRSLECTELVSLLQELGQKTLYTNYTRFHLLAWSMGVWAASMLSTQQIFSPLSLTSSIALAGTCYPIHDRLGIPAQNFVNMLEQLSPARLQAFQRSMFTNKQEADAFIQSFQKGGRSVQELQQELAVLAQAATEQPEVPDIYTSKVVTGRDRIFPARHQVRAWGRQQCQTVSLPHFPFYHWPSWSAMIQDLA